MEEFPWRTGVEMSEGEIRAMLESRGHGVLSLGAKNRGYGVPLSYSLDLENGRLVFGFVDAPNAKKRAFVETSEEATLTVYEYTDVDDWRSVIVTGTLRSISDPDLADHFASLFFQRDGAAGDSGDDMVDLDEFERTWYELRIDDLSGRKSSGGR